jgi:hypothetical protein
VYEADDTTGLVKMALPSIDLGRSEIVPVMEIEKNIKLLRGGPT